MKAIVVGSANTDLIIRVEKLPSRGNTEVGYGFKSVAGGKGANQAVCLSKLGANTSFIARFGKDEFSSLLLGDIKKYGINLSYSVIDEKHRGGVVFIIVDRDGNNTMIADLGSNLFLDQSDIENARGAFKGADLLLLQFEVSDNANRRACELGKENKLKIVLNPAPVKEFNRAILKQVDVVTPNLFELREMLRYLLGYPVIAEDEKNPERIGESAKKLIDFGVNSVVITLGERGSLYIHKQGMKIFGSYRVKPVDSTAAGDAFTASFALKYAENSDVDDAIRFATASAALTVMREGAIPSLPDHDEVEDFMMRNRLAAFQ